jgi:DNA-binding SARP family transcriptional activator
MGIPGDYEITQYKQGFYLPSDNLVCHYDVESFQSAVEQAFIASDPLEIEILLRHALDLYQGHYLEETDTVWAVRRREQLMRLHCEACIWMARILEGRGEAMEALDLYNLSLSECPQREDVYRAIIRLYLQLGRVDRAREQYHLLETSLYQKLGIKPSPESLALLNDIRSAGNSIYVIVYQQALAVRN